MADMFNRESTYGGSFAADKAKLTFAGTNVDAGGVGLLTQSIQLGYQQQINRFYEVGTSAVYMVAGRASGQISLARILGPRAVSTAFYTTFGDVCNMSSNTITLSVTAGCGANSSSGTASFTINNVVLTSVSLSISAGDMVINEQVQGQFVSLVAA